MKKRLLLLILFVFVFLISGCASEEVSEVIPEEGPQREEVQQKEATKVEGVEPEEAIEEEILMQKTYTNQITNDQPLILKGNDVLEIIDTHYIIKNDILLQDDAKLIIRNSRIDHRKEYGFQYKLDAIDNSQVIIENSEIANQCTGSLNWAFFNQASLTAINIEPVDCNIWTFLTDAATATIKNWDYFGGTTCGNAQLDVENSIEMEIELCYGDGSVLDIELPTEIDEFSFPNPSAKNIDSRIHIVDSSIGGWGVNIQPKSDVTIRNAPAVTVSVIVGLPWDRQPIVLDDLQSKHYDDKTWTIADSTLHFVNVTTYGWEPTVFNNNQLTVRNSYFSVAAAYGESTYVVEGSTINDVRAQERADITIRDSIITGDVIASGDGKITLINSRVEGYQLGDDERMFGNVITRDNGVVILINTSIAGTITEEDGGKVTVQDG